MDDNFSARLSIAIARSGNPKGDLAAHCGVALSTVSRWLSGTQPKPATLVKIAEFLSVDPLWLLGEPIQKRASNQFIETFLHAVASRSNAEARAEAFTLEKERIDRELAMETTEEFVARMDTYREVAMAYGARCMALCEAIKSANPNEPISEELKSMAFEIRVHWPEMIGIFTELLSEAGALRKMAESSPSLMKILRSV